jgi:hypothetical protein
VHASLVAMSARGPQKNTRPPAEVPVDTGKHMRACKRCKLLKTLEQVRGCVLLCAHVASGARRLPLATGLWLGSSGEVSRGLEL